MRVSDVTLRGRTVIASDGLAVGEISTLFINSDAWLVESFLVALRKEVADRLGATRTVFRAGTIEIPVTTVQSVGDAVVLSIGVDELRRVVSSADAGAPAAH